MPDIRDLIWTDGSDSLTLSPRLGGRITSWKRAGQEQVHPVVNLEGGLFRVLFAEEQYPGASHIVPHQIIGWHCDADGFKAHLRLSCNTSNWLMRLANWPQKANELHFNGLVLDKILSYNNLNKSLVCDLALHNLSDETKYLTPWIHCSFAPWPRAQWVAVDGERQEYFDEEIYWGSHLVPPGKLACLVQSDAEKKRFAVLGANTNHLRGLSGLLPVAGEWLQSTSELRGASLELPPGHCFRVNSFLSLTDDWQSVTKTSPVELHSQIEASDALPPLNLTSLLSCWMLPEEQQCGLMALSFLDKAPFSSQTRFAAAHLFAGFAKFDGRARSHVMLFANRDLKIRAELVDGESKWQLGFEDQTATNQIEIKLKAQIFLPFYLSGPSDLSGAEEVVVRLILSGEKPLELRIEPQARVEEPRPYQVRQAPEYLEWRYRDKLGPARESPIE